MKTNKLFIALFTLFISLTVAGEVHSEPPAVFFSDSSIISTGALDKKTIRRKKAIAIGLAITLGPFGVHRLYLGSDAKIPVIYSVTLGAFGILPLTDIIAILTTRDIGQYLNNKQIIMWMK
ncbi:MAG: TM2 domain-containing protein [Flavobacteriales bacterium]|nr:TM2 domain-containing protein [Flavobacteriales bacterium]